MKLLLLGVIVLVILFSSPEHFASNNVDALGCVRNSLGCPVYNDNECKNCRRCKYCENKRNKCIPATRILPNHNVVENNCDNYD